MVLCWVVDFYYSFSIQDRMSIACSDHHFLIQRYNRGPLSRLWNQFSWNIQKIYSSSLCLRFDTIELVLDLNCFIHPLYSVYRLQLWTRGASPRHHCLNFSAEHFSLWPTSTLRDHLGNCLTEWYFLHQYS